MSFFSIGKWCNMEISVINSAIELLKGSLWGVELNDLQLTDAESVFGFLREHSVAPLVANIVSNLFMPDDIRNRWKAHVYQQLYIFRNIVYEQGVLLKALQREKIPVVVLKGTSASQYYPVPEYRILGDIDLLVRHEDFERAKEAILSCGYVLKNVNDIYTRHAVLGKETIIVELHWRFASKNVIKDPEVFDDMLFADMTMDRTTLSCPMNGLVLLEHIGQHLNEGIGLRQIVDWMMFVQNCLDDDMWNNTFFKLSEKIGLSRLAITVTRMCQKYLGLSEKGITWCKNAEDETCQELFEYIISCGNFGRSRNAFSSGEITKIPSLKHPIQFLHYAQQRGEASWELSKKHAIYKPFAWLFQIRKYIRITRESKTSVGRIKGLYEEAAARRELFKKIGIYIK